MGEKQARAWHAVTATVAVLSLALQLVLTLSGHRSAPDEELADLPVRLGRLVSYFTIESNLLVAIVTARLALDPRYDGPTWRALRLAAVVGITVTGVVHFFLLRPISDLHGIDIVTDTGLHVVVPVLAVAGFALYGPRPRVDLRSIGLALAWPIVWLFWTLVVGALSGWYPYPFLDHREENGAAGVAITSVGITVFFLLLFGLARLVDQRAKPAPRAYDPYRDQPV